MRGETPGMAYRRSKSTWLVTCILLNLLIGVRGREPRIPCESDQDCNTGHTGLSCMDLEGGGPEQECECDPGTIWVPESGMCLNRGGVLCDYNSKFQPDNSTCASGKCVTKCRASKNMNRDLVVVVTSSAEPEAPNDHLLLCMDLCTKYIGETNNVNSRAAQSLLNMVYGFGLFNPIIMAILHTLFTLTLF